MTNESLSPTPPVECLSATGRSTTPFQSIDAPERIITSVRSAVSRTVMPRQQMAMASALIWQSGISPAVKPLTKSRISAEPSARPSRFLSIISLAAVMGVLYHIRGSWFVARDSWFVGSQWTTSSSSQQVVARRESLERFAAHAFAPTPSDAENTLPAPYFALRRSTAR